MKNCSLVVLLFYTILWVYNGGMRTAWLLQGLGFLLLIVAVYFALEKTSKTNTGAESPITSDKHISMKEGIIIRSPAFSNESSIPSKYTCDGENISPPLSFDNVPENTVSLVLVMDDPDAPSGNWDHWVTYNIKPNLSRLGEGSEPEGISGINSWDKVGYGGPCPHNGEHRYFFKVFALDTTLRIDAGAHKEEVMSLIQGHVLAKGELMGLYERITK